MDRTEIINARMRELEAELADIARFGQDVYADGDVLIFKADFGRDTVFTYAALKADGKWFLTGSKSTSYISWDEFVSFLRRANVRKVRMVAQTRRVI